MYFFHGVYTKTAKVVLFNQFVVGLGVSFMAYPSVLNRGGADTIRDVPTFNKFCLDIIVSLILNDIFFYYSHRLFHYGWLYKTYHKEHHGKKSFIKRGDFFI